MTGCNWLKRRATPRDKSVAQLCDLWCTGQGALSFQILKQNSGVAQEENVCSLKSWLWWKNICQLAILSNKCICASLKVWLYFWIARSLLSLKGSWNNCNVSLQVLKKMVLLTFLRLTGTLHFVLSLSVTVKWAGTFFLAWFHFSHSEPVGPWWRPDGTAVGLWEVISWTLLMSICGTIIYSLVSKKHYSFSNFLYLRICIRAIGVWWSLSQLSRAWGRTHPG